MMRVLPILLIAPVGIAAAPIGYTVGAGVGFIPNPFDLNRSVSETNRFFGSLSAGDQNIKIKDSSSSIIGLPFHLNARVFYSHFLIRVGASYMMTLGGRNAVTIKEGSSTREVSIDYSAYRLSLPISFCINLKVDSYSRFYAGFGPNLFYGSLVVSKHNGKKGYVEDRDLYQGFTAGFHAIIGAEFAFLRNISVSIEMFFQRGYKSPVEDSSITPEGKSKLVDNENEKSPEILGVYDQSHNMPEASFDPLLPSGLIFHQIELVLGINYFF